MTCWVMPRRLIILAILIVVGLLVIRVLTRSDPPAASLFRGKGTAYQLTVTRFSQAEGLVCPPFRLDVVFDEKPGLTRTVLLAEQGDNISVAQTPSTLYVFYSDLVLDSFGGWIIDPTDAKPLLCDVNIPVCAREMRRLAETGTQIQRICGSENKWRR